MRVIEIAKELNYSPRHVRRLLDKYGIKRIGGKISAGAYEVFKSRHFKTGYRKDIAEEYQEIIKESVATAIDYRDKIEKLVTYRIKPIIPPDEFDTIARETNFDIHRLLQVDKLDNNDLITLLQAELIAQELDLDCPTLRKLSALLIFDHPKEEGVYGITDDVGRWVPFFDYRLGQKLRPEIEEGLRLVTGQYPFVKTIEGVYGSRKIANEHMGKALYKTMVDSEDTVRRLSKVEDITVMGTKFISNGNTYICDNNHLMSNNHFNYLREIDLSFELDEERRTIVDNIIAFYGKEILLPLAVHFASTSNNFVPILCDEGGGGKDFLTEILTNPYKEHVRRENNLNFSNMGSTVQNPIRARAVFQGAYLVSMNELNSDNLNNMIDVVLKDNVGQHGSSRNMTLSLGGLPVNFACSFTGQWNPKKDSLNIALDELAIKRRFRFIDITHNGNITYKWDLKNGSLRWNMQFKQMTEQNDLDFVWGSVDDETRKNVSNYMLSQLFATAPMGFYDFPIEYEYKFNNRESATALKDIKELFNK